MSEYTTSIMIKQKNTSNWKDLENIKSDRNLKNYFDFANINSSFFTIDDISYDEDLLIKVVREIKKILGEDILIIGTTGNNGGDSYSFVTYNFADETKSDYFSVLKDSEPEDENNKMWNFSSNYFTSIEDILKYMEYDISFTDKEKDFINSFNLDLILSENKKRGKKENVCIIEDGVKIIEECSYSDKAFTSVVIPNSVEIIEPYAFVANCIETLVIPANVKVIQEGAFSDNCITNLIIESGVSEIEDSAFAENKLKRVEVPKSVTMLGDYAFDDNCKVIRI